VRDHRVSPKRHRKGSRPAIIRVIHAASAAADWIERHPNCIKLLLVAWTLTLLSFGWSAQREFVELLRGL